MTDPTDPPDFLSCRLASDEPLHAVLTDFHRIGCVLRREVVPLIVAARLARGGPDDAANVESVTTWLLDQGRQIVGGLEGRSEGARAMIYGAFERGLTGDERDAG